MKNTVSSIHEQDKQHPLPRTTGSIIALFSLFRSQPTIPKGNMLTAIEVQALVRTGVGYELHPFHLFDGAIQGTVECKYNVPLMKKLITTFYLNKISIKNVFLTIFNFREIFFDSDEQKEIGSMETYYGEMISTIKERGYILDAELEKLKKLKFKIITEDIPALFVIAPKHRKIQAGEPEPIILIRYGKDAYYRVPIRKTEKHDDQKLNRIQ